LLYLLQVLVDLLNANVLVDSRKRSYVNGLIVECLTAEVRFYL